MAETIDRPASSGAALGGQDGQTDYVVPRQRRIPVKPTQEELDERVNYCIDLLNEGKTEWQISAIGKERWDVSTRTIFRYVSQARNRMVESSDKPKALWRAEQLRRYLDVADNKEEQTRDRLKAMERIDKIFGLEIHESSSIRRLEVTGANGGPIQSNSVVLGVDLGSKLAEFTAAIRSAALANAGGADSVPTVELGQITDKSLPS